MAQALLKAVNITKSFAGVQALKGVSLEIMPGEVHCLAGENGCGKSTLIKVISGVHPRDGGTLEFNGKAMDKFTPIDAIMAGVQVIYQDFAVFPNLTVMENLALNTELAAKRKLKLVFVDTADQACKAINNAGRGKDKITSFYYFGHSNAHAFMLDYSSDIIGASKQWIHEKDLETKLKKTAFAPNADCWSFGCYTGNSMSATWQKAVGVPLWGNTSFTRYQPVGWGELPEGGGQWVK
jgi:ABC-type sugar transport system ATPase subunit